ncbi:MAG TPA: hypothetical protein VEF53_05950 [Patescibacteria group bacterium]|nr:hypothetical protein [Patescibacteria group bacterium]
MKSKKKIILLALALCIAISIVSVGALSNRNSMDKKDLLKAANTIKTSLQEKADKVEVATANGISIYQDEIELRKKLAMIAFDMDEQEAYKDTIKSLARNKVLYKMAQDMGLAFTEEQALEASLRERDLVSSDEKALENTNSYIQALGLTEEQYWTDYHAKEKQQYLSIQKLKAYFTDEAVKEGKLSKVEFHTQDSSKQYKDYLKEVMKEIEDSISIDIKDESYKEKFNQK